MLLPFLSHSNFSRPLRREEYKACVKNVPIDMSKVSNHVNDCQQDGSTPKYVCMFLCMYVRIYEPSGLYPTSGEFMLMGYTLTSACILSILFSKHFCGAYTENSCNIQEPINSW